MANAHSPDKEPLSVRVPRSLKVKLTREAMRRSLPVSEIVTEILTLKTINIPISAKDYEAIAAATKKAEETGRQLATVIDDTP